MGVTSLGKLIEFKPKVQLETSRIEYTRNGDSVCLAIEASTFELVQHMETCMEALESVDTGEVEQSIINEKLEQLKVRMKSYIIRNTRW